MTTPKMPKALQERRDEMIEQQWGKPPREIMEARVSSKFADGFDAGYTETAKYYEKKIEGLVEAMEELVDECKFENPAPAAIENAKKELENFNEDA